MNVILILWEKKQNMKNLKTKTIRKEFIHKGKNPLITKARRESHQKELTKPF